MNQDPVDRLIQELVHLRRQPAPAEITSILERIATAPFTTDIRRVPQRDRGYSYQGHTLGMRADSLTYHLTKRVVIEEQWAHGTTAAQYLADLRAAVRAPSARLCLYAHGPETVAVTVAPINEVLPRGRRGSKPQSLVLVIYNASRSALITGYQVSSVAATSIPPGALWLR
jgi:hypothetical protein